MASATLVIAGAGEGKTGLLTYFVKTEYFENGHELRRNCCEYLTRLNKNRNTPFELPKDPPIYTDTTDYKVRFKVGWEKWFETYAICPYYMGATDGNRPTQYVLPYSIIAIPEIQKYADSRLGSKFPRALSRIFEIRRHLHLKFLMDGHRGSFIDLKVRAMCDRVIDLQKQEHDRDELGRIVRTRWYCKEYKSIAKYEEGTDYVETVYTNEGNIFDDYDSFGCASELIPPEGVQFSTYKHMSYADAQKNLPPDQARFFNPNEPKGWRTNGEK